MTTDQAVETFYLADKALKDSKVALARILAATEKGCYVYKAFQAGETIEARERCSTCGGSGTHPYGNVCECDGGSNPRTIRPDPLRNRCYHHRLFNCEACKKTVEFMLARKEASKQRGIALRRIIAFGKRYQTKLTL